MAAAAGEDVLRSDLAAVAPGTQLRDGLERILRGNTGGLIVLGYDRTVGVAVAPAASSSTSSSPPPGCASCRRWTARVVLSTDGTRILRANVHLVPDPTIPTDEQGTRHRTAERVAKQTGYPVISVSQSMRIIALYVEGRRYVLDDSAAILSRANQALATLERYKLRLDEVAGTLSALEIEDLVTVRDAVAVSQRLEMVRRIAEEIDGYVVELGTDGRLLSLQLEELMAGVEQERELIVRDYLPSGRPPRAHRRTRCSPSSSAVSADRSARLTVLARVIGYPGGADVLDTPVSPRGYRLLAKVPRLPRLVVDRLVDHFGSLQKLLAASDRRPAGRRRRRRDPGPVGARGPVPAGRVEHPRALRLSRSGWRLRVSVAARRLLPGRRRRPAAPSSLDPQQRARRSPAARAGAGRVRPAAGVGRSELEQTVDPVAGHADRMRPASRRPAPGRRRSPTSRLPSPGRVS